MHVQVNKNLALSWQNGPSIKMPKYQLFVTALPKIDGKRYVHFGVYSGPKLNTYTIGKYVISCFWPTDCPYK